MDLLANAALEHYPDPTFTAPLESMLRSELDAICQRFGVCRTVGTGNRRRALKTNLLERLLLIDVVREHNESLTANIVTPAVVRLRRRNERDNLLVDPTGQRGRRESLIITLTNTHGDVEDSAFSGFDVWGQDSTKDFGAGQEMAPNSERPHKHYQVLADVMMTEQTAKARSVIKQRIRSACHVPDNANYNVSVLPLNRNKNSNGSQTKDLQVGYTLKENGN